ncbi:MAG: DUF3048 domain-containing protein [Acidimicrobiales bacterium]|nr:DUF3048 domain-containing protein [Acidimicrobiales bacterium]
MRPPKQRIVAGLAVVVAALAALLAVQLGSSARDRPAGEAAAPTSTGEPTDDSTKVPVTTEATVTASTDTSAPPPPSCAPPPPGSGPPGPLTGLPVAAPGTEARAPLVVKIDNYDPDARPQAGLSRADVVFEEKVEGPVSRFAAVFHSTDAEVVGPVRSARSTDLSITAQLGRPLFAYSGANPTFQALVDQAPIVDVGAGRSGAYWRGGDRAAPHNLMTSTAGLYGSGTGSAPTPLWAFRPAGAVPGGAQPATEASYHFGGGVTSVRWVWDPVATGYARWQNGTPHLDTDWCQVTVANLLVLSVPYVDTGVRDSTGGVIPEALLVGEGRGWLLAEGTALPISWRRTGLEAPMTYSGPDGAPVALLPGRSWVALVPDDLAVAIA